jgi:hypothetical protein
MAVGIAASSRSHDRSEPNKPLLAGLLSEVLVGGGVIVELDKKRHLHRPLAKLALTCLTARCQVLGSRGSRRAVSVGGCVGASEGAGGVRAGARACRVGAGVHPSEPAEASGLCGPKKRAKTDARAWPQGRRGRRAAAPR